MPNPQKRAYVSSVRTAQAEETRNRILKASKQLFENKGIEETTIALIAENAGVSPPTIFSLFKSKRGLLLALIDQALPTTTFEALVNEGASEPTVSGRMRMTAKLARQIYEAEQTQIGLLRGSSLLGGEFEKIENEQEERRYHRQKSTVETLYKEGLLKESLSLKQARDIMWTLTGRDMYRMFVSVRDWSADEYEEWLSSALIQSLAISEE